MNLTQNDRLKQVTRDLFLKAATMEVGQNIIQMEKLKRKATGFAVILPPA